MNESAWIWKHNPQELWVFVLFICLSLLYVFNRVIQPITHQMKLRQALLPGLQGKSELTDFSKAGIQDLFAFMAGNLSLSAWIVLALPLSIQSLFSSDFKYFIFVTLGLTFIFFSKYCLYTLLHQTLEFKSPPLLFSQQINWLHYGFSMFGAILLIVWYFQFEGPFKEFLHWVLLLYYASLWLYRLYKLFLSMAISGPVPLFYNILYLCALEISPLLLLLKLWQRG
jgi:hypothetical protein